MYTWFRKDGKLQGLTSSFSISRFGLTMLIQLLGSGMLSLILQASPPSSWHSIHLSKAVQPLKLAPEKTAIFFRLYITEYTIRIKEVCFKLKKIFYVVYGVLPGCVPVHHVCAGVYTGQKRQQSPQNWSYRWPCPDTLVLRLEPSSLKE